jgi:O-antigen/teichoic acid export membrane protein
VTLTSLLAILAMNGFTIMMQYGENTIAVVFILSLGILPYSLSMICDALFQGREKMHFIAYSNLLFSVIKIGLVMILLLHGLTLFQLAWLITLTYGIGTLIKLWFLIMDIGKPVLRIDPKFCVVMAKSTVTFLGINCVSAVMISFNTILLSKFSSEIEVGFYNAATQLLIPVMLLFNSIVFSVYPVLCRSFESGMQKLQIQSQQLLEVIWTIVLPTVVALYFLGETLLIAIYGKSTFSESALVLQIIIWALILTSTAKVFGLVLVASMNEKKTLRILVIDLISLVVLGLFLVSQFGLIGSAVTMLLVRIVDFVQHYIPVSRLFSNFSIEKIIWRPVLASVSMALTFIVLKDLNIWVAASVAYLIYVLVFSLIILFSAGGIKQFMNDYSYLWSKRYQGYQDIQND